MNVNFADETFDVITCSHVYEHVPDSNKLMNEIYRLLKRNGVCYFAAGNRMKIIEGHYGLPFLSIIPKAIAHIYLKILKRGTFYYENHLSLNGLKKLISKFEIIDYTQKVIECPDKYYARDMVNPGSLKQKISIFVCKTAYWLFPTYIWLLRKK